MFKLLNMLSNLFVLSSGKLASAMNEISTIWSEVCQQCKQPHEWHFVTWDVSSPEELYSWLSSWSSEKDNQASTFVAHHFVEQQALPPTDLKKKKSRQEAEVQYALPSCSLAVNNWRRSLGHKELLWTYLFCGSTMAWTRFADTTTINYDEGQHEMILFVLFRYLFHFRPSLSSLRLLHPSIQHHSSQSI